MIMKFYIPGVPLEKRIQARPLRSKKNPGKWYVQFYNPRLKEMDIVKNHLTRQIYQNSAIGYGIYACAVELRLLFNMPIPKSYTKKKLVAIASGELQHVKIPDCSNLVKFIEDCLKEVVLVDDRQVVSITAKRQYAIEPGTVVIVETIGG
jgi:Holliday junction resolvase RusA-like endonuclease